MRLQYVNSPVEGYYYDVVEEGFEPSEYAIKVIEVPDNKYSEDTSLSLIFELEEKENNSTDTNNHTIDNKQPTDTNNQATDSQETTNTPQETSTLPSLEGLFGDNDNDVLDVYNNIVNDKIKNDKQDLNGVCDVCYGAKFITPPKSTRAIPCPKCQNKLTHIPNNSKIEISVSEVDRLQIPKGYAGSVFNPSEIDLVIRRDFPNADTSRYLGVMKEVYSAISIGEKYKSSLLIASPYGCGQDEFVFSAMQLALTKGLTVAPFLDTAEIDRLDTDSIYGDYSKESRKLNTIQRYGDDGLLRYTYEELIAADYCFVRIKVAGKNTKRDLQVLQALVDQRGRKGKPTIIVSNFYLSYLVKAEQTYERFCVTTQENYKYTRPYYIGLDRGVQANYNYNK